MATINTGKIFADGEQITAGKLNLMFTGASFGSGAFDGSKITTQGGALTIAPQAITLSEVSTQLLLALYPVGSIYFNADDNTNPATLMGFGVWEEFGSGKVLVGKSESGDFSTLGNTGGSQTVNLTNTQIPNHSHLGRAFMKMHGGYTTDPTGSAEKTAMHENSGHTFTTGSDESYVESNVLIDGAGGSNPTGSDAHENMPPYVIVKMWRRTS